MQPLATCLQGKLTEVYFRFKKNEEIIDIYEETYEKTDKRFQSVYGEDVNFINKLGTEEK